MNAKPMPKTGTTSDGRLMHYSVGAIIENDRGEYFLVDRRFEPYGYACMAGHIDEGEVPLTALLREGREELGTELRDVAFLREEEVPWNTCYRAPAHYWYLYRATVDPSAVKVNPHEAKRSGWFSREQLRTLVLEPVWKHWLTLEGIL